jgi:hypothetical protein
VSVLGPKSGPGSVRRSNDGATCEPHQRSLQPAPPPVLTASAMHAHGTAPSWRHCLHRPTYSAGSQNPVLSRLTAACLCCTPAGAMHMWGTATSWSSTCSGLQTQQDTSSHLHASHSGGSWVLLLLSPSARPLCSSPPTLCTRREHAWSTYRCGVVWFRVTLAAGFAPCSTAFFVSGQQSSGVPVCCALLACLLADAVIPMAQTTSNRQTSAAVLPLTILQLPLLLPPLLPPFLPIPLACRCRPHTEPTMETGAAGQSAV